MTRKLTNDPAEMVAIGLERLGVLATDGNDMTRPRLTTHSFSGHADAIDQVAVALRHAGFATEIDDDDARDVSAQAMTVTDEPWLREAMVILCRVADRFGVTYEGWEALADQSHT